ncbi:DUF3971 domain-containing protein [Mesorhizobium sp. M6A.T.Ce.TU.016.01.1.1]|uniref:YhdP family protein n=1 Tax=Mesorhizobium sp. M6A.T.Ce.TU.016.01.1.1 TaxID=2496783 RepID=UPI000FCADA35|nr:DUF3971 domain-containing protein [Mesorhizobium sp. M6A.T.Ce.TU.016.01.1.1]RUU29799.1 hypothetical protein EOC94_13110 [Mesorhizobium sp. M6A.T.Ce.TU.016.01.1.1]
MDQEQPQHEKIRFRRDEITDLETFPSACRVPPLGQASIGRGVRVLARLFAGLVALVLLAAVAVYAIGISGFGTERLRTEAEIAIEKLAGVDVDVAVGPARLTLDGSSFIALQVSDVSLKTADGKPMADAGRVRFGIRLIPLLSGEVRLTSARISDARIMMAAIPTAGDWTAALRNDDGLIDPERLSDAVFANLNRALDTVQVDSMRQIDLSNVDLVLPEAGAVKLVRITDATVAQSGPGGMEFSSDADVDGRALTVAATATRDTTTRLVTALDASVEMAEAGKAAAAPGGKLGAIALKLAGSEGSGENASRLTASLSLAGSVLDLGPRAGMLPADVDLDATLVAGANKVQVDRLQVKTGRSTFDFAGSVGPKPTTGTAGEEPSYRYDLTSDRSILAPSESSEPALNFIARVAGVYQTRSHKLVAEQIGIRSGGASEALGTASVEFVEAKVPGISVAFNVHDMPVSHVKQLWPWFSARNARLWVLKNLFGGRVVDASLQFQVVPGRLGNGIPLSADEVFGRFQIEGARFDTAGHIPPIRDAVGVVEFHGNDVDVRLSSGNVYMVSGRTVAASNGTMTVKAANRPPVIGALDIDVAGEASAIAELASYEPINAMRHVGLLPDDLSGTVTGHVRADIPLQSGVDTSKLDWLVALDYKDLSLAKPFEGQAVTEANGSITVEPNRAVISAKALLNGIPAELELIEPLNNAGPPRSRKVALVLDDKMRATAMPGLSALLSGTIKVAIDKSGGSNQTVSADLTNARLDIPWAGWSKGPGIPAKVTFAMTKSGDTTTLSDFDLDGKTFSIDGGVVLVNGALSSARFSKVTLNRGDDVAVSVKRSGKGYAIDISGNALDARSLIKQFTSDVDTATKATGSDAISVSADVNSLTGFHNETLSNLKLDYSAAGSRVNGLRVSATASSGAAISISNTTGAGRRALNMTSADAGAILRFLNIYEHMEGGSITLALAGASDGPMKGLVDSSNFFVVNEPKLASLVSTTPAGDSRSLNEAVKANIDTSRVKFERGFSEIEKGAGYLKLANGVLRGPRIGTTFQGTLYDRNNNMDMTGTFMPVYGLNRIFGELPLFGALLGNGRDRGLIGVTYRLRGDANKPKLDVNPLSVIAPGIFRSIFEYR